MALRLRIKRNRIMALALALWLAGAAWLPGTAQAGRESGTSGTLVFQVLSGGPIYALGVGGGGPRYLTTGMDPALSPDGQWVAFTRWQGSQNGAIGSLWIIGVDGSGERAILGDLHQPKAPTWSPDGTQIILAVQNGGRLGPESKCSASWPSDPVQDREDIRVVISVEADGDVESRLCYTLLPHPFWGLRVVDVATGAFEDLPGDRFSYAPAWDPANAWRLVYAGEAGLVALDLNRDTTWQLTGDGHDHAPTFSPDGSRIAVSYWQHDHWEVHVMGADGSGRARLTETPRRVLAEQSMRGGTPHSWNNVAPAWSPDGSQLVFLSDRTGGWEVWVMDANGSNQHPLLPAGSLADLGLEYHGMDERSLSWR
jgi:dipeptidyl aminopeptidase/acylaminoacyl peptidase